MRNKVLLMIATLAMSVMLSACGHEHIWTEATCTAPKTCSECGETEGEVLEHTWVEATCTEEKHCIECGETEGEVLEHTWIEANYQAPKTCSVCSTTDGEPLTPDFELYGFTINAEEGGTYDYVCSCQKDSTQKTVAHATFSDYRIIEEDADLGLEKRDGYEWRAVHISVLYDDANANRYNVSCWYGCDDYYHFDEVLSNDVNMNINYNGTNYKVPVICSGEWSTWNETETSGMYSCTFEIDFYVQVPIGYDGVFFYLVDNHGTQSFDGMKLYEFVDENTLFFRMG